MSEDHNEEEIMKMLQHFHHLEKTDEHGEATIVGQFGAGGKSGTLWRGGSFDVEGKLTIAHPEYNVVEGWLENFLQRREFPIGSGDLNVRIVLLRK